MKICYLMVNGRAKNIRFVDDSYLPIAGETLIDGASLPPEGSLDNPTPEQIAAEKDDMHAELIQNDRLVKLLFEVNFDQENRLRTLSGQPTITRTQHRNGLLAVWRSL